MPLPRAVQIASGLLLLAWAALCLAGSIALLWMEPRRNWLLTKTVGGLLLAGSVWGIAKAIAMIRGPSTPHSSLLSINTMRGFAIAFASLPFIALMLGTVSFWPGVLGCISYAWIAYRILRATSAEPAAEPDWNRDDEDTD